MNTAIINIKTDPKVKKEAQVLAERLGFSLSSVLNAFLRDFLRKRTIAFSDDIRLELTPYAKRMLKRSEEDVKRGRVSPWFSSVEESDMWLNDPNARYQNGDPVR